MTTLTDILRDFQKESIEITKDEKLTQAEKRVDLEGCLEDYIDLIKEKIVGNV